ncbi:hypothetical protein LTR78_003034 [Recurvomyces mirabilis]|uniref:Uncharacterized protein n=1 Tax=Recurvomyces mirabilis TaxID=574656 RepID=A0AAE0WRR2_9PEZI|nr:hypothetical protein LTR78_003034 [Recurvomyces mirabilis]KAK5157144.1 hypothetical protein LTS14_004662 [Recurvomyces mirabilis]
MASAMLNEIRDFEERIEDAWWSYLELDFAGSSLEDAQISVEMLETVIEETRNAVEDLVALANVLAANEQLNPGEIDIQARE